MVMKKSRRLLAVAVAAFCMLSGAQHAAASEPDVVPDRTAAVPGGGIEMPDGGIEVPDVSTAPDGDPSQAVSDREPHRIGERIEGELSDTLRVPPRSSEALLSAQAAAAFNGCYGNQLTGLDAQVYRLMTSYYREGGKTGEYVCHPDISYPFNGNINAVAQRMYNDITRSLQNAIDAFAYDNPEVFWAEGWRYGFQPVYYGTETKGVLSVDGLTISPTEISSGMSREVARYQQNVNAAVNTILSKPDAKRSRYHLVREIHDYVCRLLTYNKNAGNIIFSSAASFIGAHQAVCEGYAETFKVLCDRLNIPCVCVSGYTYSSSEGHMWNYVQMNDGKWYLIDTTWDDDDDSGNIYYFYFLAGSGSVGGYGIPLSSERTAVGDFSEAGYMSFAYPVLNTSMYQWNSATCRNGHTRVAEPTVAATCTAAGRTAGAHCSVCGAVIELPQETPVKPHTVQNDPAKAPTCTQGGRTAGSHCSVCGEVFVVQKQIAPLGHTIEVDPPVAPTLESEGKTEGSHCSVCGTVFTAQQTIPRLSADMHPDTGRITPASIGKTPKSFKAKAKKKGRVALSWKKLKKTKKTKKLLGQIQYIQVQYSTDPAFTRSVVSRRVGKKKGKLTLTLPRKTIYYIRARYVGYNCVSGWTKVKRVRTK